MPRRICATYADCHWQYLKFYPHQLDLPCRFHNYSEMVQIRETSAVLKQTVQQISLDFDTFVC